MKRLIYGNLWLLLCSTSLLFATIYDAGEDNRGWRVYDTSPKGATVTTIFDEEVGHNVAQFNGSGTDNGFILRDSNGGVTSWNNREEKTIRWSMKYDEEFVVYLKVKTIKGQRYLYYTNKDGAWKWKNYIHHGLGSNANDGTWRTFTRDLEADLQSLEPDNRILSVNAFLIRGSGLIDYIELLPKRIYEHAEDKSIEKWRVYDGSPSGATISNIIDNQKGDRVIQLNSNGTQNGFILGGWAEEKRAWRSNKKRISWSMNYSEDFVIYINVSTREGNRYLYYTNQDSSLKWKGEEYLLHGLGSQSSSGTWQTVTRNLEQDLQDFEPNNKILSVNGFLIRGSGRVDDIEMLSEESLTRVKYEDTHYYLSTQLVNWRDAESFCRENGLQVLTITSEEENNFISSWLSKNLFTEAYWLDGTDKEDEGEWKWRDNEQWSYENWAINEPNNLANREDNLEIYASNGSWNDVPFYEKNGVICEDLQGREIPSDVRLNKIASYNFLKEDGVVNILLSHDQTKAYVTGKDLIILDISDVENIEEIGRHEGVRKMVLSEDENRGYAIKNGVTILDLTNLSDIKEIGNINEYHLPNNPYALPIAPYDIELSSDGKKVFISQYFEWFFDVMAIDVSDEAHPQRVGLYHGHGESMNIVLSPSGEVVVNLTYGVEFIDTKDPSSLMLLNRYSEESARDLVFSSDEKRAFLLKDYGRTIEVLDLNNLSNITKTSSYSLYQGTGLEKVLISKDEKFLYLSGWKGNFRILNIEDLSNIYEVTGYTYEHSKDIAVSDDNNRVYLLSTGGLTVLNMLK